MDYNKPDGVIKSLVYFVGKDLISFSMYILVDSLAKNEALIKKVLNELEKMLVNKQLEKH